LQAHHFRCRKTGSEIDAERKISGGKNRRICRGAYRGCLRSENRW
jgi:hypothetical protein